MKQYLIVLTEEAKSRLEIAFGGVKSCVEVITLHAFYSKQRQEILIPTLYPFTEIE